MCKPRSFDRDKEFKEFVEWAASTPDAFTVPMFCAPRGYDSGTMAEWVKEEPKYVGAFKAGKELIGLNRLRATQKEGTERLEKSIYLRNLGNYDLDQNLYERTERKFDLEIKSQIDVKNQTPPCINEINKDHSEMLMKAKISSLEDELKKYKSNDN